MSDVPLGTLCSGGIDSGLITALAADAQPGVVAYNAAVPGQPGQDEGPYAQMVADRLGVELRTVELDAAAWRAGFVDAVAHVEHPLLHPSSVPMAMIAERAHGDGVKVLLSGEGADELFAGYGFMHTAQQRAFATRSDPLRRIADLLRGRTAGAPSGSDPAVTAGPVRVHEALVRERAQAAYASHAHARAGLEAACLADLGLYLPHLLNRQDKTTMQHSVETRVPFLDPEVVALALHLPVEARVEPAPKGILRELALERLPRAAVERPKRGFGVDANAYLEGATDPAFLQDGVLRELLGRGAQEWRTGVAGARFHMVLLLWSAEVWCRLFLEGQDRAAVHTALWR